MIAGATRRAPQGLADDLRGKPISLPGRRLRCRPSEECYGRHQGLWSR